MFIFLLQLGVDGYAMVELLLNAPGTDANIADKRDGDTPLHNLASVSYNHIQFISIK